MYDTAVCDACDRVITQEDGYYHFLIISDDCDLCTACYGRINQLFIEVSANNRICDVCQQYITDATCWQFHDTVDMCNTCRNNPDIDIRKMLAFISNTSTEQWYLTDHERMYKYIGRDKLDIPEQLQNRIVDFEKEDLDSVVRPPCYDWNPAKWQFIDELQNVPHFMAMCGWAVRCESGQPHQVASVVCDDHGRYAFNIFYEDVEHFLEAESHWFKNIRLSDQERVKIDLDVATKLKECGSCDNKLIALAANSFAVYERLIRNLSLYYG